MGNQVKPNYLAKSAQSEKPLVERDFEALKRSLEEEDDASKVIKRRMRLPPTDMKQSEPINNLLPTIE